MFITANKNTQWEDRYIDGINHKWNMGFMQRKNSVQNHK